MTNKIFASFETELLFADSAQAETAIITLSGLAADGARISAQHDFGAASKSREYAWSATFQMATAGVIGETIDIWLAQGDGTNIDGEGGVSDASLATAKINNLKYIGSVVIDTVSIDTDITASGKFELDAQFGSIVVHNNSVDALKTDTAVHGVRIKPVPDELQ